MNGQVLLPEDRLLLKRIGKLERELIDIKKELEFLKTTEIIRRWKGFDGEPR